MSRAVEARIDTQAIRHNLEQVRSRAPRSKVMAIIKANGYGHGMLEVARALETVQAFGVACLEEGEALRAAGFNQKIVLLGGFFSSEELQGAAKLGLDVTLHHVDQIAVLEALRLVRPVGVWLKIDSGMHRLGIAPDQAVAAWERLKRCPNVAASPRLMSHFASADEPDSDQTRQQMATFDRAISGLEGEQSLANSAGLIAFPEAQREWVRPGLMLYGASPFADRSAADLGLRSAMTLSAPVMAVNRFRRGDAIGYGAAFRCPEDMPIGVIAIGYGDGYPRHAAPGTPVLVKGRRVPLLGRVSMDSIFVDLRAAADVVVGDRATLWGAGLPVEEIAKFSATIPYELTCKITARVKYIY